MILIEKLSTPSNKVRFDHILDFALKVEKDNPKGLIDLIRALLKPLQSELLMSTIENELYKSRKELNPYDFFISNEKIDLSSKENYIDLDSKKFLIHLSKDSILPCPWNRERYIDALGYIGTGKEKPYLIENYCRRPVEWKQDSNHRVIIWQPWGIVFVNSGNHSIATGILEGEGTLTPTNVYDMGSILDKIKCDGNNYILINSNEIIEQVRDVRIAAIFEIGRLLRKNNIVPMKIKFDIT